MEFAELVQGDEVRCLIELSIPEKSEHPTVRER